MYHTHTSYSNFNQFQSHSKLLSKPLTQVFTLATISFLVATLLAQQKEEELAYLNVEEVLDHQKVDEVAFLNVEDELAHQKKEEELAYLKVEEVLAYSRFHV